MGLRRFLTFLGLLLSTLGSRPLAAVGFYNMGAFVKPAAAPSLTCTAGAGPATVSGFKFYASASMGDCNAACATHGGANDAGTISFSGSGGSAANCSTVATAFNCPGAGSPASASNGGLGCAFVGGVVQWDPSATTESAMYPATFRFCACNS